jgi:hypothetical protein
MSKNKLVLSESDEQIALFQRINTILLPKYPEVRWTHAIPNAGGSGVNGIRRGVRMVAEGLKAGVSDICHPVPRWRQELYDSTTPVIYTGLYIELKRAPSISPVRGSISYHKPSKDQQEFGDFVRRNGWMFEICCGQDEAFDVLSWYLGLDSIKPHLLNNEYSYWNDHERGK